MNTLLQLIMQLLSITNTYVLPLISLFLNKDKNLLLNKLTTPPFYAKHKTDSDAEFYKESKYEKVYSVSLKKITTKMLCQTIAMLMSWILK